VSSLSAVGVTKSFGAVRVLRGLDLNVTQGSLTAVLGPSGSGKTTLLRLIAGFERVDSGSLSLDQVVVDDRRHYVPAERRGLGYVGQDGSLFPHLSVASNVGFGIRGRRRRRQRVEELLELVDLAPLRDRHPHELSGGQQQRVALARALAVNPRMLLLDEPFTALDPALRASVRADVAQIIRRSGTTAVLVTHDQDEALSMADEVAVLRDGVVVQHGSPHELYNRPIDPELAAFLGAANLLTATLDRGHAVTVAGRVPIRGSFSGRNEDGKPPPAGAALIALLRPEQLLIRPITAPEPDGAHRGAADAEPPSPPGSLGGSVVHSEYYGHDSVVRVRTDDADTELLTVRLHGDAPPPVGTRVTVTATGQATVWLVS
jgi:iron(III) transport system ATP-binding protein